MYKGSQMRSWLKNKPKTETIATVIDEKYYWGNSPVSNFNTYKYAFSVGANNFTGTCPNQKYRPGNKIKIEYVTERPEYNQIKE